MTAYSKCHLVFPFSRFVFEEGENHTRLMRNSFGSGLDQSADPMGSEQAANLKAHITS